MTDNRTRSIKGKKMKRKFITNAIRIRDTKVPELKEPITAEMTETCERSEVVYFRKNPSPVWKYFVKLSVKGVAQCTICYKNITHGISTSNMLRHLDEKHEINLRYRKKCQQSTQIIENNFNLEKSEAANLQDSEENLVAPPARKRKSTPRKREPKHTKSRFSERHNEDWSLVLIRYLATDLLPFSCLDNKGLSQLLKKVNPLFKLPDLENLMSTKFPREVNEAKTCLALKLNECTDLCLSTENWRYHNQDMTTFFAHFINSSYELKSFVVSTITGPDNGSASALIASIQSLSEEMKFTDKVFALISDGTSEDLKKAAALSNYNHLTCFGHSLNSLILNAFNNVPEIKRLRAKILKTAKYFNENVKSAQQLVLVQRQNNVPVAKLQEENSRNWLSIFEMFSRIIEQYEAINTVLCQQDNSDMCILDAEIETIREIVDVLTSFEFASKQLCSDKNNHLSIALPLANILAQNVNERIKTAQDIGLELLNSLQTELEKHFSDIESNHVMAISTLLDPRFKRFAFQNQDAMEAAEEKMVEELHSLISLAKTSKDRCNKQDANKQNDLWANFDKKISLSGVLSNDSSKAKNEVNRYFKESLIERSENPLEWWQLNQNQFPTVSKLAKKYLSLPVTAKRAELIFTSEAMAVEKQREALQPDILFDMIFLNNYFS